LGKKKNPIKGTSLAEVNPLWLDFQVKYTSLEHIRSRIDEGKYFLELMDMHEQQWQHNIMRKRGEYALRDRNRFLYCFLAFLSAVGGARNYLRGAVEGNSTKTAWLDSRMAGIIFKIFTDLRNFHTHDETIRLGTSFDVEASRLIGRETLGKTILPALNIAFNQNDFTLTGPPKISLDVSNLPIPRQKEYQAYLQGHQERMKVRFICREYLDELEQVANYGAAQGHLS
jgi:hypothetical protein